MGMYRNGKTPWNWHRFPWELHARNWKGATWRSLGVTRSDYYDFLIDQYLAMRETSSSDLFRDEMTCRADYYAARKVEKTDVWKEAP